MRKIIQINTVVGVFNSVQRVITTALCDDGSLWMGVLVGSDLGWTRVTGVPEGIDGE